MDKMDKMDKMEALDSHIRTLSVLIRETGLLLLDIDDRTMSIKQRIKIVKALQRCNDALNPVVSLVVRHKCTGQ